MTPHPAAAPAQGEPDTDSQEWADRLALKIFKHTPGPWSIENDSEDYLRVVAEGVQYPIADLGTVNADDYPADVIATLRADAALIAAAPDLLDAILKSDDAHWTPAMRAAIAKATGGAP